MAQGPIESRTRGVEQESLSDAIIVEGGRRLKGRVRLQGAKNLALQALTISILADEPITFTNFPDIADTRTNLGILREMGAQIFWDGQNTVTIDSRNISSVDIDPRIAIKTTGSRYFIPVLVRRRGEVITGPSGGDRVGGDSRYDFPLPTLAMYNEMGIKSEEMPSVNGVKRYRFTEAEEDPGFLDRGQRYFGPTIQAILSHAVSAGEKEYKIFHPSIEPEVIETIKLLNIMGADIRYEEKGRQEGKDSILIKGRKSLTGAEFRIMSDPNVLVSYAVAALITNGEVLIEGIDHNDKVTAFLEILDLMNADYVYDEEKGELVLKPSLSRLKPVDLVTDFWFAQCHTDWQQILTPLLAMIDGVSFIDENVQSQRFTSIPALESMGGKFSLIKDNSRISRTDFQEDGLEHTLRILGPVKFYGANVKVPQDIRGATSVLLAALSAKGASVIHGVSQIQRGLENYQGSLNSLGAKIDPA